MKDQTKKPQGTQTPNRNQETERNLEKGRTETRRDEELDTDLTKRKEDEDQDLKTR